MSDLDERIRRRAYELWERAGRPDRTPDQFWFEAEQDIEKESGRGDDASGDIARLDAERLKGGSRAPAAAPNPDERPAPDPAPNTGGGERAASQSGKAD